MDVASRQFKPEHVRRQYYVVKTIIDNDFQGISYHLFALGVEP